MPGLGQGHQDPPASPKAKPMAGRHKRLFTKPSNKKDGPKYKA